jgi:hypothetical protein
MTRYLVVDEIDKMTTQGLLTELGKASETKMQKMMLPQSEHCLYI